MSDESYLNKLSNVGQLQSVGGMIEGQKVYLKTEQANVGQIHADKVCA